jgi:hypothetical protein
MLGVAERRFEHEVSEGERASARDNGTGFVLRDREHRNARDGRWALMCPVSDIELCAVERAGQQRTTESAFR